MIVCNFPTYNIDLTQTTVDTNKVLDGYKFHDNDGDLVEGTMTDNGSVNETLNCGETYTIPEGYHDGTGKVTVAKVENQITGKTTAESPDILSGETAYTENGLVTGSMVNNGAVNATLQADEVYTIPQGYHNGKGKVIATGVDTSDATATSDKILSGYSAYVGEGKIEGTMAYVGGVNQSLDCGETFTIPAGYHNGTGKITSNSLISQLTEATATSDQVLEGYKVYTKQGLVTGTMVGGKGITKTISAGESVTIPAAFYAEDSVVTAKDLASQTEATATSDQILSGSTAWVNGEKIEGTMVGGSGITATLSAGESVTIPAAFYAEDSVVTAKDLASQTEATATTTDILNGKTAYVNGNLVTGTLVPQTCYVTTVEPDGTTGSEGDIWLVTV